MGPRPAHRVAAAAVLLLAAASSPHAAPAQRLGPELRVNSYTTGRQQFPQVAAVADGFVVVWESSASQDGSGYGIFGQRFDRVGTPVGVEFRVNTSVLGDQSEPAVAAAGDGFVVVWIDEFQDGSATGVFGQRFGVAGVPAGDEFQVNTETFSYQTEPAVAADSGGGFVVVWESLFQDGSDWGVFGQRFGADGLLLGDEFQVNSVTQYSEAQPAVAAIDGGGFVVVWSGYDGYGSGVFGQRYDAAGVPAGGEFQVNSNTGLYYQEYPDVGADTAGNFVVTWSNDVYFRFLGDVVARRFDAAGVPLGPDFPVNSTFTGQQSAPTVAVRDTGEFVVAWTDDYQDGSFDGIFGRLYEASGVPAGLDFPVNTFTGDWQYRPDLAVGAGGAFVAVWTSWAQDGSEAGAYAQRLSSPLFADGFETGDTSRWSGTTP